MSEFAMPSEYFCGMLIHKNKVWPRDHGSAPYGVTHIVSALPRAGPSISLLLASHTFSLITSCTP
eukprot:7752121-Ditylum_brightwellii.AAC.1